ncbi:MAG: hypothetical protein ACLGGX_08940 [Bdellovibrionia bacterium]
MLKLMNKKNQCYCAFCKSPRRIYRKKTISLLNVGEALAASLGVMFLLWQKFDPRFVLFFAAFLVVGELFIRLRWRTSVLCPHCGFDPVLYLKDSRQAAEKVKNYLAKRKQDPEKILAKPLNLPVLSVERSKELESLHQAAQNKGRLVSKQI